MTKKTYWKDIWQSFSQSKGRFFSLFSLMGIGALALIGLKVTMPDMQSAAQTYLETHDTMDLAVMADYGLSEADVTELKTVSDATVEFGYLTDLTIADGQDAVRIFSLTDNISKLDVQSGRLPEAADEIALATNLSDNYQLGDQISFATKSGQESQLKSETFTVTGFVQSSEVFDNHSMGVSSAGTGNLASYAVVLPEAFSSEVYSIARLTYDDLAASPYYTTAYQTGLDKHQKALEDLLADNGQARLDQIKAEGQKTIDEATKKIIDAEAALTAAEKDLVKTEQAVQTNPALGQTLNLDQLKADFAKEKAAAERDIAENRSELNQAQADLDALTVPDYQTYTRETFPSNVGYNVYTTGTTAISAVGNVFPIVLYGVAAMVTLTTMTRYVDEERTKAGIFKALGYSKGQIMTKFLLYGLVASGLGTLVGSLLGTYLVSPMISQILAGSTVLGQISPSFHLDWFLLALGAGFLAAVLPAYLVARKDLAEETARLLQAKPPVAGATILLERLTPLWRHLSFTHKVTARNIFRYKQRMLMTIFGVAGSAALLFAGLGIQSSIAGVATTQFQDLIAYDMVLVGNSRASEAEKAALSADLASAHLIQSAPLRFESLSQTIGGEEQSINLFVADSSALNGQVKLRERTSGHDLTLDDSGAIISEKLAKLEGLAVGDYLKLELEQEERQVRVAGISEMYAGHFVYLTPTYYEQLTGQAVTTNASLLTLHQATSEKIEATAAELLRLPAVSAVVQNTALETSLQTIASSLQSIMLILISLSVLLGVVILYNLTNINVAERLRELSTIKVLGFHNREVTLYIYRETMVLSLVGLLLGLLSGVFLHRFLIELIASSFIMFKPTVSWMVYLAPVVSILGILAVLGFFVNRKLRRVDMLEALKSLE